MMKLKDAEFDKVEKLIKAFCKEHPDTREQTIAQFKAWLEVNFMVQVFGEEHGNK